MFNPLDLSNKRFIVTGAASGIGRACALYLSKLGADLLLLDLNGDQLTVTKQQCSTSVITIAIDLTDSNLLRESILKDVETNGPLDGMVHCAGITYISPLKMVNEDKIMNVFKVNTYAGVELAKLFTNKKVFRNQKGSIVFISSVYGIVGSSANVGYALSKGAVLSMTKSLAIELAPKGLRVNCVAPGFVKTEMAEGINSNFDENYDNYIKSLHPLGWGKPEYIASAIAFLLSDMSTWITGATLSVDGGFTAQ